MINENQDVVFSDTVPIEKEEKKKVSNLTNNDYCYNDYCLKIIIIILLVDSFLINVFLLITFAICLDTSIRANYLQKQIDELFIIID